MNAHVSQHSRQHVHKRLPLFRRQPRNLNGVPLQLNKLVCREVCALCHLFFTSLPSAHDLGGENPYIDTKDVLKLLNCGRLGRQAAGHPWSALRVVEKLPKDCPTAEVLLEAKAAALHPERYQSSLSRLSTKREGEAGKEAQAIRWASQSDGQTSDRQTDRQTGRNKADERWYLSRPCSVL